MVLIIAECCVNFRNMEEASLLIEEVAAAGADAVKFQYYTPEQVDYHLRVDELVCMCLTPSRVRYLAERCRQNNIEFLCTPMFPEAVRVLDHYVKRWKIRYKDRHNRDLFDSLQRDHRQILVSCDSINDSVFFGRGGSNVASESEVAMVCVPEYPPKKVVMPPVFAGRLVGFSSHYPDPTVPLMAAARGAKYIEVHVKLDCYDGNYIPIDDAVSISMSDFAILVNDIRQIESHGG